MRKEEIKVYTIDELDKKATEKVIEKYRDINLHPDWYEFIEEEVKEKAREIGFLTKESDGFYFSLFQQGNFLELEIVAFAENIIDGYDVTGGLWYKSGIRDNSWKKPEIVIDEIYNEKENKYIEDEDSQEWEEVREKVEERVEELADYLTEAKKKLTEEYMIRQEADQIIETIKANDMEFMEDGRNFFGN
jgi:hypothetical protein